MNSEHVDPKRGLHRSELENLIGHYLRTGIALESDLNAGLVVGEVAHS